ncbi:MAG: D-alanyl-D-alanine carboxypeptidase [Gammaproteobacteria bacterium]|nr:D-alanyl-D-alanine carboxypeptidase [Gammaproteobacteria bacterium]
MSKSLLKRKLFVFICCFPLLVGVVAATPKKPVPRAPSLQAKSYYLEEFYSGRVLAEKDADKRIEPASITKLMTAYVVEQAIATGDISLDDKVKISEKAWRMKGSKMFIEVGKEVLVADLLKGLVIQSGNDASVALAEHVAGTEEAFVGYMNHQAEVLGLENTQFKNVTGWPAKGHYMSARDIAILARAILTDFPEQYSLYKEKEYTYNNIKQYNRNKLLWRDASVDGLKTGHTESAGYCLVSSAKKGDMRLLSVVLGTKSEKSRAHSSQSLLNYGFRFFETHRLYAAGKSIKDTRIWKGTAEVLPLGLADDLYITIPRGQYKYLKAEMELTPTIIAPAEQGQTYGIVKVALSEEMVVERPLIALSAVKKGGLLHQAVDSVKLWLE